MKSGKILFAIFVFTSFMREGLSAFRETGDKGFFIIIFIVSLLLSGLLIRSAFKPQFGVLQNDKYKRYLWNFLKVISIMGILGLVINIGKPMPANYIVEYKGLKIPIDKCVYGNVRIIKDLEARKDYCDCMAKKLVDNETVFSEYSDLLQRGEFDDIINLIKSRDLAGTIELEHCFNYVVDMEWTEYLKNSVKNTFLNELRKVDLKSKMDVEGYCDCLVNELVKYPANKIASGELYGTTEWTEIDSVCAVKHRINVQ